MVAPIDAEANAPAPAPTWGIPHAIGGFLVAFVLGAIVGSLVLSIAGYDTYEDAPLAVIAVANVGLWAGFIGAPIVVSARLGAGWVRDYSVGLRAIDVPVAALAGIVAQLVMVPLVSWPVLQLAGKTSDDLSGPARELADKATGSLGPLVFVVMVGIVAPIAEELFFRGLVLRAFERRLGTVAAVIASSAFFAATHGQPLQFPALFVAGVLFAVLVLKTGRLGPAIIAHMAFNLTTVVLLLWL